MGFIPIQQLCEEAIASAKATLQAIHEGGCFDALPVEPEDQEVHIRGTWLLAMLSDQLSRLDERLTELGGNVVPCVDNGFVH